MNIIDGIEAGQLKDHQPKFRSGDTLRVHVRIIEGAEEHAVACHVFPAPPR